LEAEKAERMKKEEAERAKLMKEAQDRINKMVEK
jgi:hypothetical protein